MKLDLNTGTFIHISGELGKYHSLPIEILIKIAQDLQNLVMAIAKFDLPTSDPVNLDNFKIELVDFKKGSALPKFAFTPRVEFKIGYNWQAHRNVVAEHFEKLIEISDSGDYSRIRNLYPEPIKRNPIVETLYSFVNDFGTAPVQFVEFDEVKESIVPIFKINRFNPASKKDLLTEVLKTQSSESKSFEAVGKIRVTNKGNKTINKVIESYSNLKFSLEYAPEIIIASGKNYILKYPLRCLFAREDDFFIIQSEMLNIIGTGMTEDEAEVAFAEEFDFIYQRFNSLADDAMTNHNQLIKNILNQIVIRVE